MIPQPQNLRQYLQFGFVLVMLVCLLPTRLFLKSQKWHFSVFTKSRTGESSGSTRKVPINNTAECRYLPEALLQFTNALHDRPESTALKPWTLQIPHPKYPAWHFPGLSSQLLQAAFGGRKTMLIGDSTLFGLERWLQTLFSNVTAHQQDALGHMQLTPADYAINPDVLEQVGWEDDSPAEFLNDKDGTYILWDGHRGDPGEEACQFDPIWSRVITLRPDILVVNFGLHWLHLMGGGRDVPLCSVQAWLHYDQWLEQVVQVAEEAGVKLLLFKTTNRVCQDHFWGEYSDTERLYERQDAYIMSRCKREIERLLDHHHGENVELSLDDITRYCTFGVLNEHGSKDLNNRLWNFVQTRQRTSNLIMDIFGDHDVQTCAYTEPNDGRHFHPLNLLRIRLLANMIQCLYPQD